jgi:hypothetical protein
MVFPRKVLHLTVDENGLVSLWDDYDRAIRGKQKSEVYCQMVLTLSQTERLKQAQKEAKQKGKK